MPLHLMQPIVIPKIFANICHVRDVQLNRSNLTITINTYAPRSVIPRLAHIAIRRQLEIGDFLLHIHYYKNDL